MEVFNLRSVSDHPFEEREKNVLYRSEDLAVRIISLPPGGGIPPCEMASYVIFTVISGKVLVEANGEKAALEEGWCLISEPAVLSMRSDDGARVLGVQVASRGD
jgi:quercetin dioxygenase-like cupin family protein